MFAFRVVFLIALAKISLFLQKMTKRMKKYHLLVAQSPWVDCLRPCRIVNPETVQKPAVIPSPPGCTHCGDGMWLCHLSLVQSHPGLL